LPIGEMTLTLLLLDARPRRQTRGAEQVGRRGEAAQDPALGKQQVVAGRHQGVGDHGVDDGAAGGLLLAALGAVAAERLECGVPVVCVWKRVSSVLRSPPLRRRREGGQQEATRGPALRVEKRPTTIMAAAV
jgi:hypothetical protein